MTQGPNPELAQKDFFSFIMFTIMMGASFGSIADMYANIMKAVGASEHLMDIIGTKNEKDLLNDAKELSEHMMLLDLGRNDVGRVVKAGSVKITSSFGIEKYSHVMHIVSNVEGELKNDKTLIAL